MIWKLRGASPVSALVFLSTAAVAVACGGNEPTPRAPTETTAAAPAVETVPKEDFTRVERERDEAREKLRQETARYEEERTKLQGELQSRKERDELAAKAWASIESADTELKTLKEKAARAPAKQRQKMDKAIADAKAKEAVVERDVRKIPSEHGAAWPDFKRSMDAAIDELQRAVRTAGE